MKWIKPFIFFSGGILLVAALTRFLIAAGPMQALGLPDPLAFIPLRYSTLIVGLAELAVAWVCLFGRRLGVQIAWLVWLGTSYLVFWVAVSAMGIHPQATAIGAVTDPLRWDHGTTGLLTKALPWVLALGSYAAALAFWLSREGRGMRLAEARRFQDLQDTGAGLVKMTCPACGGHVKFPGANAGQQLPCPHCQAVVTLRRPENLKMACFFCQGHIEFPAHAIGTKMACPHCNMDITLKEQA
jgi:hypothetical protein